MGNAIFDALNSFEHETSLVGSTTSEHVAAYYLHMANMADIDCHKTTYQLLSHGRFLEANYTTALQYGPVLGNITAKSGACVTRSRNTLSSGVQKRWFGALFASAELWYAGLSFAGQLFNTGCQIFTQFNSSKAGKTVCAGVSILTALGGGFNVLDKYNKAQAVTTTTPSYSSYSVFAQGSGYQLDVLGRSEGNDFDYTQEFPGLMHGYENRNLTWAEYFSANITHRSSFYYDGSFGGTAMPLEFFHLPHATKEGQWTTHVGVDLTGGAIKKREFLQKRQSVDYYTWCNGGPAYAGWQPDAAGTDYIAECDYDDINGESQGGGAGALYYGFDAYQPNENQALAWDMGVEDSSNMQGFQDAYGAVYDQVEGDNVWDSCVCFKENGQWTSTGSLQYSWDNSYNGYSQCWAANCDGGSN